MGKQSICVIIAAYNAEATIGRAIASALAQPEVIDVVVVDDRSTDGTAAAVSVADDASGRLRVIRMTENLGPSAARNAGIAASTAPLIAILDADDFFLPNRFDPMLCWRDLDIVADNILFVAADDIEDVHKWDHRDGGTGLIPVGLPEFVRSNISRRGKPRGELGFLKPVLRRDFMRRHHLRYNERLRLGEDFDLYVRMLAHGARFALSRHCGYVAIERAGSLSAEHSAVHLAELAAADAAILRNYAMPAPVEALLHKHRRHVLAKWRHRRFLDDKKALGLKQAVARASSPLHGLFGIGKAVAIDKTLTYWHGRRHVAPKKRSRLLIPSA